MPSTPFVGLIEPLRSWLWRSVLRGLASVLVPIYNIAQGF